MLIFPSPFRCSQLRGMDRTRHHHMRSPFKQDNVSSSSLEGMERPIRSFKSFMRTVPPHPSPTAQIKPLPPAPSPKKETPLPPSPTPSSASRARNLSVASWKAPEDWYNVLSDRSDPLLAPPLPPNRTYSPLLPEPSPSPSDIRMESIAWQLGSFPLQSSPLQPIFERWGGNPELAPRHSPPGSPLPDPPTSSSKADSPVEPLHSQGTNEWSPGEQCDPLHDYHAILRQTNGTQYSTSHTATIGKAFASLGISPSGEQPTDHADEPNDSDPMHSVEYTRPDRQYLRDRKLRALDKGCPLMEDSWEDPEMDDRTRQLSFSQDYHDLLADQYQEMSVGPEEVLLQGVPHSQYDTLNDTSFAPKRPPKDHELVPQPLSWQKGSGPSTPRSSSVDRHISTSSASEHKGKHRRIISWVPHHLSAVPKRRFSRRQPDGRSGIGRSKSVRGRIPEEEAGKIPKEELRFSMFFPPGRPHKFGKRFDKTNAASRTINPAPTTASPPQTSAPLIRLPGGLALVRRSPSSALKSEAASVHNVSSEVEQSRRSSRLGSGISPVSGSNLSDHRSSISSVYSQPPVAPGIAIRNNFRASTGSSYSYQSGTSSPSHPLAQEILRSPPPPPPIPRSSMHSTPLSPEAWRRFRSVHGEESHKPGFLEKAKEARRKHNKEARQEKLKKSIRVLGPTDPGVVAGYVRRDGVPSSASKIEGGRMPGYMVHGPI